MWRHEQCHLSLRARNLSFPYGNDQESYLKQDNAVGICRLNCTNFIGLHVTAGVNSDFVQLLVFIYIFICIFYQHILNKYLQTHFCTQ